jgi:hypothetical protein
MAMRRNESAKPEDPDHDERVATHEGRHGPRFVTGKHGEESDYCGANNESKNLLSERRPSIVAALHPLLGKRRREAGKVRVCHRGKPTDTTMLTQSISCLLYHAGVLHGELAKKRPEDLPG